MNSSLASTSNAVPKVSAQRRASSRSRLSLSTVKPHDKRRRAHTWSETGASRDEAIEAALRRRSP